MKPPRDHIVAAPAVLEIITAEDLGTLARQAATGYRCVGCDEPGELGDGLATVVVRLMTAGPGGVDMPIARVRLAHHRCSPSEVIQDPGIPTVPAEADMQATAVVLPVGLRRRALLVVEPSSNQMSVTDGGERQDLLTADLLSQGMSLVSTLWERVPAAPGWLIRLPSRVEAIACFPHGEALYTGELDQPMPWRRVVRSGRAELLVGSVGLAALTGDPLAGLQALEDAARQGRLVGAAVAVQRPGRISPRMRFRS